MKILILNGPNLNLLGRREPSVYGNVSFDGYFKKLKSKYKGIIELEYFQSNSEGALIDKIHQCGFSYHGIVLNAGAYTHTSLAIADAIRAVETPVVELHISNVYAREEYRHRSLLAPACRGCICGFGLKGYELAVDSFLAEASAPVSADKPKAKKKAPATKTARKKAPKASAWDAAPVLEAARAMKQERKKLPQIAAGLNENGFKTPRGKEWTTQTIGKLLRQEI